MRKIELAQRETRMPHLKNEQGQNGKVRHIILWSWGAPASILILIFLLRGCT